MKHLAVIIIYILKIFYKYMNKSDLLSNKKDPSNIESEPKISPIIKSTTRITMPEQNKFKLDAINKWGCYFLCLVFIQALIKAAKTNKDQNLSRDYIELMFKGLNGSNINKINAFIKNPNGILSEFQVNNDIFFTDEFITRESIPLYFHNTLFVARYKYKEFNHFCIVDKNIRLLYDSLGTSLVRSKGYIDNLRPFVIKDDKLCFEVLKIIQSGNFYAPCNSL